MEKKEEEKKKRKGWKDMSLDSPPKDKMIGSTNNRSNLKVVKK